MDLKVALAVNNSETFPIRCAIGNGGHAPQDWHGPDFAWLAHPPHLGEQIFVGGRALQVRELGRQWVFREGLGHVTPPAQPTRAMHEAGLSALNEAELTCLIDYYTREGQRAETQRERRLALAHRCRYESAREDRFIRGWTQATSAA